MTLVIKYIIGKSVVFAVTDHLNDAVEIFLLPNIQFICYIFDRADIFEIFYLFYFFDIKKLNKNT